MDPHMGAVYHSQDQNSEEAAKYNAYLEYGKRFMNLVEEIKNEIKEENNG